jgi:hypothetical protein
LNAKRIEEISPCKIWGANVSMSTNLLVLATKIIGGLDDDSLATVSARHFDRNWKEVLDGPEISSWWSRVYKGLPRPVVAAGPNIDCDR